MTKTITKPIPWNVAGLVNEVAIRENKLLYPRDYIYASEVGAPFIDRYYKMKAVPATNPPNQRSLRKFVAGRIWEYVFRQIFLTTGVFKHAEVKVDATYLNCLSVHGRLDFIAGGLIDGVEALEKLEILQLPDFLYKIGERIIEAWHGMLLEEKIIELKAVSTFAMDMVERKRAAIPQHTLQAYHYEKNGYCKGVICYVCKDDSRMAEFEIDAKATEPLYMADIERMTYYFRKKKIPPAEKLVIFDDILVKFSKNLGVEYSPYLTKVYGYKTPDDYRKDIGFIDKWNRTLTRMALIETGAKTLTGKPIVVTTKNIEVMQEINKSGYRFNDLLKMKVEAGKIDVEEIVNEI